jgi:hypothetical protein
MDQSDTSWTERPLTRRRVLAGAAVGAAGLTPLGWIVPRQLRLSLPGVPPSPATEHDAAVPNAWFDLIRRLIQGTPGYTPPVASRALGCAGLSLYEAIVPGMPGYASLSGIVTGLPELPTPGMNVAYHWPTVANSTLAAMARNLFPTAPADLLGEVDRLEERLAAGAPAGIRNRSIRRGRAIATAIHDWSKSDGGHEGYLRNFPADYVPPTGPGQWVPTPPAFLRALQPYWGSNRCMALHHASDCDPGPPPDFSTATDSAFFAEALEVVGTVNGLTAEQLAVARFWSDDPGTTATPPGHSVSILTQLLRARDSSLATAAEAYAKVGIAVCDAFISCWYVKYRHNLLRPISYIRANIDDRWGDPLPLATPPFPEHTSGHSVQSGAAAVVLTSFFGVTAFTDRTHEPRGLPARSFASFDAAAEEAAISRLYGGIHYRAAIERGLEQGRWIGATVAGLPMLRGDEQ